MHTVGITTAKVTDGSMTDALLHGDEEVVLGDRAYTRNDRNLEAERGEGEPVWAFPFKRQRGAELIEEQALLNRMLAPLRAAVEHPFRILKRQFGYGKAVTGACSRTGSSFTCCSRSATSTTPGVD